LGERRAASGVIDASIARFVNHTKIHGELRHGGFKWCARHGRIPYSAATFVKCSVRDRAGKPLYCS
jgi:hypothetical protein